jgi:hypothetical protein
MNPRHDARRTGASADCAWRSRLASATAVIVMGLLLGCYPTTTRPAFLPEPGAQITELELGIPEATRALAIALDADSIPVRRTEARDGWLETGWFDTTTMQPTSARRLGLGVVKVRAWVDPSRPNYSNVTIETVYRPFADPSAPERELEALVPINHRVAAKLVVLMGRLSREYGGVPVDTATATDTIPKMVKIKPR